MVVLKRLKEGGNDMKRILTFSYEDDYFIKYDDKILTIKSVDLILSSKLLYEFLFQNLEDYPDYEIENQIVDEKLYSKDIIKQARLIHEVLQEVILKICDEIKKEKIFGNLVEAVEA